MSRVLVEHGAIVNKFMGDGIFAFFNSPIWPCEDHPEAACACALSSLEALGDLNRDGGLDTRELAAVKALMREGAFEKKKSENSKTKAHTPRDQ